MSEQAEYEQDVRLGWGFSRGSLHPLNGGVVGVFHNTPTDKKLELSLAEKSAGNS